ncbi:HIT domain-containing protein [Pseudomonas sp. MCal1]|uniref:HIT family protein n=1 Tax=Pseudomonas sp. MCal1 TaxID=2919887 RepID=UPI002252506F|nr:HIT domain-containing protein [Pseudomonas sp. MCal1]MCX4216286.1 HIT domain-containing protein [Pseudomonas sp. MCal1]
MLDDCVFCRELQGSRDTNFARLYPELRSRVIAETESFVAFPCIGQLVEGHFLVVPRNHDCTLAQTRSRIGSTGNELTALLNAAHEALGRKLSASLLFEHGALSPSDGGCGIYHAHLHVLPNAGHINCRDFIGSNNTFESKSLELLYEGIPHKQSYALIGSDEHGFTSWNLTAPLPSQTLRKKVAAALDIGEWDWRQAGREKSLLKSLEGVNP